MSFSQFVRTKVSKNKRRYRENGFDLDLSYVTDKLVAMGFPSENVEGVYRNPFREVFRFFELRHKDHYKVYNLCSERDYDISKFHNRVAKYPFDDHNAPPFGMIFEFCKDVDEWLNQDPQNVAVIHCKAGKGRTGLMICAYLLYCRYWKTAEESLSFYGAMRTINKKGVTIPSQIRYVYYVAEVMKTGTLVLPPKELFKLDQIVFHTIPKLSYEDLRFQVYVLKTLVFTSKDKPTKSGGKKKSKEKGSEETQEEETLIFNAGCLVNGDIKIQFYSGSPENKVFHFWFNTSFVPDNHILEFTKPEIDKVAKDKHHKVYKKEFKISLHMEELESTPPPTPKILEEEEKSTAVISPSTTKRIADGILNRSGTCSETQRKATEIVESLLTQIIQLYIHSAKQEIEQIHETKEYTDLELATSELQKVSLDKLTPEEKLCFWINVYNLLALHGNIVFPIGSTIESRMQIMEKAKYDIAGQLFSLLDIEFGILRNKSIIPEFFSKSFPAVKKFDNADPRKVYALTTYDPRINFALNPGTTSGPIVRIYHPNKLYEELDQAMKFYLQDNVELNPASKEISFPQILEWYYQEFGKTQEKMIRDLTNYLTAEQKAELARCKVIFEPYDWSLHYSFKHLS